MMLVGAVLLIVGPHMPESFHVFNLYLTSPIGARLVHRRGVVECLVEGQSHTNEANAHLCNLYKYQWGRISKTGGSTNSYGLILNSSKLSMAGGTKDVCIPAGKSFF